MGIDWSRIKTLDDIMAMGDEELFDFAPEYDADLSFKIVEELSPEDREDAEFWAQYRRGLMLLTGPPGQGKDMLAHMLGYKFKRYFGMRVISDTRPRKLFGAYIPFSGDFLVEQLDRAMEIATGHVKLHELPAKMPKTEEEVEYIEYLENENARLRKFVPYVTDDGQWISSRGEVFIRKAIWLLNEFGSRYMYKREPHQPIKRTLLKCFTIWRHLQSLIVGIGTERSDFDPSCFPKVTCEVKMQRLLTLGVDGKPSNRLLFGAMLYPLRYVAATGELMMTGKAVPLLIDGDEPRQCLCGYAWKDLFNTDNAVAFEPPKSMRRKQ